MGLEVSAAEDPQAGPQRRRAENGGRPDRHPAIDMSAHGDLHQHVPRVGNLGEEIVKRVDKIARRFRTELGNL